MYQFQKFIYTIKEIKNFFSTSSMLLKLLIDDKIKW